jgi:hypothetical protein
MRCGLPSCSPAAGEACVAVVAPAAGARSACRGSGTAADLDKAAAVSMSAGEEQRLTGRQGCKGCKGRKGRGAASKCAEEAPCADGAAELAVPGVAAGSAESLAFATDGSAGVPASAAASA